ncbi:hypothetical protein [Modestobacter lapidis]|nr:hypothetical protein [Modestobacter lapidis]
MPEPGLSPDDVRAVDARVLAASGDDAFGITAGGFLAKPFARLLAERIALAQALFGADVDLTSGSVLRRLLELTALEDARTWAALGRAYDDSFVATARGEALTRLGAELGVPRPYLAAEGTVDLALAGDLPDGTTEVVLPAGARLTTSSGHRVALDRSARLGPGSPAPGARVVALVPGPGHDLDPGEPGERLDRWEERDPALADLLALRRATGGAVDVRITHSAPLTGGTRRWDDDRYRDVLLRAPRSLWTVEAVESAAALVPGVRQVQVRDPWGGLDLERSIFGNFNFLERLFSTARDPAAPAYLQVVVVPSRGAVWSGPGGLHEELEEALEDLRPAGVQLRIEPAEEVGVGIAGTVVVDGVALPTGDAAAVNGSAAATALRERLLTRVRGYVDRLRLGEPVRAAEVSYALMSEPGVVDLRSLTLLRAPVAFERFRTAGGAVPGPAEARSAGENLAMSAAQVAVFLDDPSRLVVSRA